MESNHWKSFTVEGKEGYGAEDEKRSKVIESIICFVKMGEIIARSHTKETVPREICFSYVNAFNYPHPVLKLD